MFRYLLDIKKIVTNFFSPEKPIPFDFLINGELLRVSLQDYITSKGLSSESTIELEYTRSILPPTFLASYSHPDWVSSVDILKSSPPSKAPIVSGCYDGIVRTWSLAGQVTSEFSGHTGPVKSVKFLEDGKKIVSGSMDRSIRVWKVPGESRDEDEDAEETIAAVGSARIFTGHKAAVNNVATNSATSRILSAGADCAVGLWTSSYKQAPPATVVASTREANGKRRRKVAPPSRGPISMLESHSGPVTGVIFDAQDPTVGYSVSLDHTIKTWDLVTSELVDTRITSFSLLSIAHLPRLSLLCCGSSARHVTLHDPRTSADETTTRTLYGHTNFVVSIAASPESEYMFSTASHDGTVRVWDVRANKSLYVIDRDTSAADTRTKVFGVDWSREVGIVSAGEDKRVQVNRGTDLDTAKVSS